MLYWDTISDLLKTVLLDLMAAPAFASFRLVGGTALSLHLGHRMSIDIDLFTDAPYESIDFIEQENYLKNKYAYFYKTGDGLINAMGGSYYVGDSEDENLKVDLYYSMEPFIQPAHEEDGVRMATVNEIAAMKMDVIRRTGRKKDFWDIDEMMDTYALEDLIKLHEQRHPYTHNEEELLLQLVNFKQADGDFDPDCKRGKIWELVKYNMLEAVEKYKAAR
ncbi:nucleotidyl transferase AbiEii/AbiGii toxin family protein [Chitinophaga cymbidii]|uniref:Nucleotidyltransferase n=1 Tax=Chitinophaga cymbidii TaxID=1096750 RepID=A0A512RNT8_9BACT|nr:nucleotidyl transferase AbiEii/AbiGii toxin family protein [Chitinophaga cymbidii]GEP97359.1 hypothetical protein CCY01nite_36190 [Chitinophaga cymbidii]